MIYIYVYFLCVCVTYASSCSRLSTTSSSCRQTAGLSTFPVHACLPQCRTTKHGLAFDTWGCCIRGGVPRPISFNAVVAWWTSSDAAELPHRRPERADNKNVTDLLHGERSHANGDTVTTTRSCAYSILKQSNSQDPILSTE